MNRPIAQSILLIAGLVKAHGPCTRAEIKKHISDSMNRNLNNNLDRAVTHGLIDFEFANGERVYDVVSDAPKPRPVPIVKPGIATFWQPVKPWERRGLE